jgi:hypothetical protein
MMWMTRVETKRAAERVQRPRRYNPGMKILSILVLAAALGGCATPHEITPADKIPVYESVTGAPGVATVVKRLWVDSWVTAFNTPSYRSADEAAADLKAHAAALGGHGIINFGCYRRSADPDALLACNGTVVRFK